MPFISDAQMAQVQTSYAHAREAARKVGERAKAVAKEQAHNMMTVGEVVGGAAAIGFVRGKYEADGSQFTAFGVDIQAMTGVTLVGLGMTGVLGKQYNEHLLNVGSGILGAYAHDVARSYGKTGQFSAVAGYPRVGSGSHLGAQFGHPSMVGAAPMNDVLRSALSASGV